MYQIEFVKWVEKYIDKCLWLMYNKGKFDDI